MKKYNKYIGLFLLSLAISSCDNEDVYKPITEPTGETLNVNGLDFSKYVSVGASFTAGFTDGALFKAGQENSFPNILASKFAMAKGGEFTQPLTNDNIGGLLLSGNLIQAPRFYFNGSGPSLLNATPTTDVTTPVTTTGNFGVPGAKSFHLLAPGYGNVSGLLTNPRTANPYYVRFASSATSTVLGDVMAQQPTFFTLSEIGGNDVLGYALSGGESNMDADNYNPITPTTTFNQAFGAIISTLTSGGAKGVVANIPYITSLAHFTTVPYNPLDPSNPEFAAQIPLLNNVYGAINAVYTAAGEQERSIVFATDTASPVVIYDEDAKDLTIMITQGLKSSPSFIPFVKSLNLPEAAAPLVAQLLGNQYGKARSATEKDLFVLPSSRVIGTVNETHAGNLITASGGLLPANLAGQFSAEGITLPLADKWVPTPKEQDEIIKATDAYNSTIEQTVKDKGLALVDFKAILEKAATTGYSYDEYNMTTDLVTGGLISLDGVHLTGRGYAVMATEILKSIDATYGSNFTKATNGMPNLGDYPTNYSPTLK